MPTPVQILFIVVAFVTLGSALMVVTARNLVHSALWLIAALFGVAIFFAMLEAPFLAVVQVVVYIGAIAILMIFTIMLTRKVAKDTGPGVNENWTWGVAIAVILFAGLVAMFRNWEGMGAQAIPIPERYDTLHALGIALVSPNGYVLAFELASVLLLAALIGAIYVALEKK